MAQTKQILVAQTYSFSGDNVVSVSTLENESILGSELSYDTMTVEVVCSASMSLSAFKAVPYGSKVALYLGGSLNSVFYLDKMRRVSERGFELDCVSFVGLLDKQKHVGGVYKGTEFSTVLASVLGGTVFTTYITQNSAAIAHIPNATLNATKVYGWLPYDTRRNNLRRLLLAMNVHIFKNASTKLPSFEPLSSASSGTISAANLYIDYSEEVPQIASQVTVTEHAYFYDSRESAVELFNNSSGYLVNNYTVVFSQAPIYPSSVYTDDSGLTISEVGENYAVVSGRGILYGVPYAHNTYDVIRTNPSATTDYEVSITDDGLISIANSENVADRLYEYYTSKDKISTDIVYTNEVCGSRYSFVNRYGESILGYLSELKKTFSSFVKASCEFITGFAGITYGNNYDTVVKLTGSGTWTKPAGVTRFRAVLIGAGSGGDAGYRGQDGSLTGSGGKGGEGGVGGAAGRVYEQTFDVDTASADYAYSCGSGGTAGGTGVGGNIFTEYRDETFVLTQSYNAYTLIKLGSYYYVFTKDYTGGDYTTYSSTNTYSVGDVVVYANLIYVCISAVTTAGTWSTNSSHFQSIIGIASAYSSTSSYSVGDCIYYTVPNTIVRKLYICTVAAPAGFEPDRTSFFKQIGIVRFTGYNSDPEYFLGKSGGDTSLTIAGTSYYASSGQVSDHGFIDLFNDITYAIAGLDGLKGGDGGDSGSTEQGTLSDKSAGTDGEDVVYNGITYSGGVAGKGTFISLPQWTVIKNYTASNGIDLKNLGFLVTTSIGGGGGGGAGAGNPGGPAWGTRYSYFVSHVMVNSGDEKYNIDADSTFRAQEYVENTGGLGGYGAMPSAAVAVSSEGSGGNGGNGGGGAGGVSSSSTASGNVGWYKGDFCPPLDAFIFVPTDFTRHYYGNYSSSYSYFHGQIVYGQYPEHPGGTLRSAAWYVYYAANTVIWYRGTTQRITEATFYPLLNGYVTLTNQNNQLYWCKGTVYSLDSFEVQCVPDVNADNVPKRDIRNILENSNLHGGYGSKASDGADGCILIYYKS